MKRHPITAWRGGILTIALACGTAGTAAAQSFSLPLPGTPRTADGQPDLSAPAPRTAHPITPASGAWTPGYIRAQ